jgi:hypothetical protein
LLLLIVLCFSKYDNTYVLPTADNPHVPQLLACDNPSGNLGLAAFYFLVFILMSAMVMLSLFIGTVTMSMNKAMETLRLLSEQKKKKEAFLKNKAMLSAKIALDNSLPGNVKLRNKLDQDVSSSKDEQSNRRKKLENSIDTINDENNLGDDHSKQHHHLTPSEILHEHGPHRQIHQAMYVQGVLQHKIDQDPNDMVTTGPFGLSPKNPFAPAMKKLSDKVNSLLHRQQTRDIEKVAQRQRRTARYLLLVS